MIFKKNKVIFLHYPKTGGNSVQDALREYSEDQIIAKAGHQDGFERFEVRSIEDEKISKHATLQDYYNSIGDDVFNYKVFINIRNPYDRMVSCYFSPHRGSVRYDRSDFAKFVKKVRTIENFISIKPSFFGTPKIFKNVKFLRFENLNEDFDMLIRELGIQGIRLPHRNASMRGEYAHYYDDRLIKIVSARHNYEINLGGYRF